MALLRWDEEEKKEEDGFSAPTPIIAVDSVQNSWQPTQATDDNGNAQQPQNDNYLMSEEKAQVDNQLQQRRAAEAAEAARRAEMARQAAIARQNDAINRQNAANAQAAAQAQAQARARNQASSAAKYQGGDKKRNEGGITGFFKDVGAGIQQGLGALGDIAIQGGSVIGSIGKKDQELVRHMDNSQKVREWLYGFKDINNENLRGTSGADAAAGRVASGQGNLKDFAKVGGTGLQAGIDATMFMNPARLATMGVKPITTQSVSLLSRTAKSPAVRFALRDAAFFGSLQGTATFQNAYAESGGNLEAAVEAALTDAVIGGALQGTMDLAGSGIKVGANRTFNSLRRPSKTPSGSPIDEVEVTPVTDERSDGNVSFEQENIRSDTPPVADGIVTPVAPDAPQYTPVADNLTPVRGEPVTPEPLTEAPDQLNGQTPPDWDEVTAREVAAVREQPAPEVAQAPAVEDGTAQVPTIARPVDNMPTVRSEEVRALQESRAGTDQAEEAVINQRLQELDTQTPSVYRSEAPDRYGIGQAELGNGLYTGSKETAGRRADGTISEEGLYEYKVNPEAKVLDSSSDEFSSFDSQASTHPSLKEPGISDTEWRRRKTALLGQLVREAGYDGVKRGTNQFVGMSERALIPVTEGAPTYRSEPDARSVPNGVRQAANEVAQKVRTIYRGGKPFNKKLVRQDGTSFSTNKSIADRWRGSYKDGVTEEFQLAQDAKVFVAPKPEVPLGQLTDSDKFAVVANASRNGYDAVDMTSWGEKEIRVINPDKLTQSRPPEAPVASRLDDEDRPSMSMPEYLRGEPSNMLRENSRISKLDAPKLLRESGLDEAQVANVMGSLYKGNKGASYKSLLKAADREAGFDMPADTLTDVRAPRESEIADNAQIRELDNSLETIRQRRAQMIADGRSENYYGVKQLDKAADAIIREQSKIANGIRRGEVDKSESGVNKAGTLTKESESTLVSNDGWESYRDNTIKRYERQIRVMEARGSSSRHIKGLKDNLKALQSAKPNEVYRVNPTTGKIEVHPASELLKSFSKAIGEGVPPIAIGNIAEQGSSSRLPANWAGADGTYVSQMSRLDYRTKNAVYHETMHHIDHFVRGYKGDNPKMQELRQLRDAITLEDMKKFKGEEWRADNKAEYVAHAMDSLLDGRIKAGQLGASVLKYIKDFFGSVKEALSSSYIAGRKHSVELAEYVKRLDAAIHDAGTPPPKQKPLSPGDLKPVISNLPPSMGGDVPIKPRKPKKTVTPEQKSINDFAKRVFSNTDLHKDFQRRLAKALGLEKDTESSVDDLLAKTSVKVSARDKSTIQSKFNELEAITTEYNSLMKQQRKGYKGNKIAGLDEAASKRANKLIDTYGRIERDLNGYVRKINGKRSIGNRVANVAENLTGARNANILSSVGGVSRNISQELGANILETVLHPVRMARGVVHMPAEIARAYKRTAKEFTVKPKTVSEVFPYAIGNTYRFLMSPVTGIANVRKGVARDTLAESLLRAQGETPTRAEIKKFAGAMGADSEVVANNLMGILNGMTSHGKGLEVMRSYQEFVKTGSAAAKESFLKNTESASNLAAKMSQVASESDKPRIRIGVALMNTVFPFVNTATNLAKTAATYNLNPVSRSINDEVLKAVRANPANVLAILKNKAATYGVLGGVYALYEADVIGYNDGEEVDKPKGIYIDMGNGTFHAVRATPIEIPIAAVVTAAELVKHTAEGDARPYTYYLGILGNSLPYVDSTTNLAAAAGSAINAYLGGDGTSGTNDNGYAAKAYGVNMAKSFVPYSNNGVIPAINSQNGKSTNAKSVYDKDMAKWFDQSLANSFGTNPFTGTTRDSLKDSRDAAGRVRTVDQQGLWTGINKTINDKDTATHNDTINNLVTFARQNGLGKGTKDMFNTYDTGKNNNFKSVQDSITFLDAVDGKPDNTKKLEQNEKLADLASQIRDGFWGDSGDELLTLNGQNLYSDVSVPNADGTKNSRLPLNMQSIKNAIAATDLPKDQRDRMYEISQANQALYSKVESKEMTYEQYKAVKAESEQEYVSILSNSESYKKLDTMMNALEKEGFFKAGGLGSTKSGQTYLWNSLNALLGSKGATPAAQYPKDDKGFTPWGRRGGGGSGSGKGFGATVKYGDRGSNGIKWTPVQARRMADAKSKKYTPLSVKVKLGSAIKKDKTQDYSDRSF